MAKSSIHIEAGNIGFFSHNDRSRKTKNSIFSDEENFVSCSSKEAIKIYKDELEIRTQAYLKNHPTRKKLHSKTHTHLSAIVNLNAEHTQEDLRRVCDYLEKTFDTKVLQFSIHRDEGHISENGEKIKNYHAHIEFMGLDSEGNSIKRQIHRKELIALQSATAELLQMERGTNYTKEQKPRPKRLDTYEYKEAKEQESRTKRATKEDLSVQIAALREALQAQGAERKQYAEIEALNRELKDRIKNKELTIEELKNKLKSLADLAAEKIRAEQEEHIKTKKELSEARETILKQETTIGIQKQRIVLLEQNISDLEHKVRELESELKGYRGKDRQSKRREVNEAKQSLKSKEAELSSHYSAERSEINIYKLNDFMQNCSSPDRRRARKYLNLREDFEKFSKYKDRPEILEAEDINLEELEQELLEAEQELVKTDFKQNIKTFNEIMAQMNDENDEDEDEEISYGFQP